MKKLFLALLLIITAALCQNVHISSAGTTTNLVLVDETLAKLNKSIVDITAYLDPLGMKRYARGTAVCIKKSSKETKLLTANHLVSNEAMPIMSLGIVINDKKYSSLSWQQVKETDVIVVTFLGELDLVPLDLDLSDSDAITPCLAVGIWGNSGELTFTVGHVARGVCKATSLTNYDFKVMRGFILSSALIASGYSGGALISQDGKLLGINIMSSGHREVAVDIRYIMSNMPSKEDRIVVKIPWDPTYNVVGARGFSCLPHSDNDTMVSGEKILSMREIGLYLGKLFLEKKQIDFTEKFVPGTIASINGKKYIVTGVMYNTRNKTTDISKQITNIYGTSYLYLCDDGWSCAITLSQPID